MNISFNSIPLKLRLSALLLADLGFIVLLLQPKKEDLKQALTNVKEEYKTHPLGLLSPPEAEVPDKDNNTLRAVSVSSFSQKPPQDLKAKRVRKLQSKILRQALKQRYGLKPSFRDTKVLSRISSVPWICTSLQKAAGIKEGEKLTEERLYRIRFVFRAFVGGLAVDGAANTGLKKSRSLFPSSVKKSRKAYVREQVAANRNARLQANRLSYEAHSFNIFLEMQSLILRTAAEKSSRINIYYQILKVLH